MIISETLSYQDYLKKVQENGLEIKNVPKEYFTEELMSTAVKKNGLALAHIDNPSFKVLEDAVRQNGMALEFVKEKNEFLSELAVMQNGRALQFVEPFHKTPSIERTAVNQTGWAIAFVKEQTNALSMIALQKNGAALRAIQNKTPELCLTAVQQYGWALRDIDDQTPEVVKAALEQDGSALQFVKDKTPEVCLIAVKQSAYAVLDCENLDEIAFQLDEETIEKGLKTPNTVQHFEYIKNLRNGTQKSVIPEAKNQNSEQNKTQKLSVLETMKAMLSKNLNADTIGSWKKSNLSDENKVKIKIK